MSESESNILIENHFYMATTRNDDGKHCDACGKSFSDHKADVQLVNSGPSHRPPVTWKYPKET